MANSPAGAGAHRTGPQRGPAAAPPPVHHQGLPGSRRSPAGPVTQGTQGIQGIQGTQTGPAPGVLAWLPYLLVLGGVAVGLYLTWRGSQDRGHGAAVVGGALLAAAVVRLVLPPRYAGLLVTRGKALDVAAFAVLGAAVLGVAASLP
jgi:Protein of unknown function (DUF3017)